MIISIDGEEFFEEKFTFSIKNFSSKNLFLENNYVTSPFIILDNKIPQENQKSTKSSETKKKDTETNVILIWIVCFILLIICIAGINFLFKKN